MINDVLSMAPWWFWIFIAPELLGMAIWLLALPFIFVGSLVTSWIEGRQHADR